MFLSPLFRALCLGATLLTTVSGQRPHQGGQGSSAACWTCGQSPGSGCFECLSKSDNGNGTSTVELDFSGCKQDDISWTCCTGSTGIDGVFDAGACDVPESGCFGKNNMASDPDGVKCEDVSIMFVLVPSDAVSVTINTHDGATRNNASPAVGADPMCAGQRYQGGRCATRTNSVTAHCLETIYLSTCPSITPAPSPKASSDPTLVASAPPTVVASAPPTLVASAPPTLVASAPPTWVVSNTFCWYPKERLQGVRIHRRATNLALSQVRCLATLCRRPRSKS